VNFLQEVLVPEAAIRLISQDKGNTTLEEARKIMEDSGDFGNYVQRKSSINHNYLLLIPKLIHHYHA